MEFHLSNFIVAIIVVGLWLGMIAWVNNDANENGQIGCLWAIICAIFPVIGMAVYLIFFRGVTSKDPHFAIRGQDDLRFRSMYRDEPDEKSEDSGKRKAGESRVPMSTGVKADPSFVDAHVDNLIASGRLKEARDYVTEMIDTAREMGDSKMIANYRVYEGKIGRKGNDD